MKSQGLKRSRAAMVVAALLTFGVLAALTPQGALAANDSPTKQSIEEMCASLPGHAFYETDGGYGCFDADGGGGCDYTTAEPGGSQGNAQADGATTSYTCSTGDGDITDYGIIVEVRGGSGTRPKVKTLGSLLSLVSRR